MADPVEQVLPAESRLKEKVPVHGTGPGINMTAISRAEQALGEMSGEFERWIEDEIVEISVAREAIRIHGYAGEPAEALLRCAHDLKGQGVTFGYPLVTRISASLCKLLDSEVVHIEAALVNLIHHHVDAIRAIVRDRVKGEGNATALSLVNSLLDASGVYLSMVSVQPSAGGNAAAESDAA